MRVATVAIFLAAAFVDNARAFTAFAPSASMGVKTAARSAVTSLGGCFPGRRISVAVAPAECQTRSGNILIQLKMQADEFSTCKVTANKEAADGLRLISLEVGAGIASGFKVPGQYVKARSGPSMEKPGFFAIASAPGASASGFDFVIKRTDGSSWICDSAVGSSVEVTTPQGPGFKFAEKFDSSITDVILLATGSGIAPIKAVVESKALKGKNIRLYYGCRTPVSMSFQNELSKWETDCGVKVVPCISQGEVPAGMRRGYVQKVMMEDGIAEPANTGVLFCGVNDMVKQAKEILSEAGVKPEMMLGNF